MSWKNILKVDLTASDVRRLGNKYAIKDMYDSKLMTEEEYNKLPDYSEGRIPYSRKFPKPDKKSYHHALAQYLKGHEDSPFYNEMRKYYKFHHAMNRRLEKLKQGGEMRDKYGEITTTYPTLELYDRARVEEAEKRPPKKIFRRQGDKK
tara:strand:+ start:3256 stop:3702 length:447 start_codon:yes stop_codon:yes gene_type:complete